MGVGKDETGVFTEVGVTQTGQERSVCMPRVVSVEQNQLQQGRRHAVHMDVLAMLVTKPNVHVNITLELQSVSDQNQNSMEGIF